MNKLWEKYKWDIWNPKTLPLIDTPAYEKRIAICTTCMGRTSDLKATLPANIASNADYRNLEFVVLDYGSKDDMYEFMMSDLIRPFLTMGRVRYLRTKRPNHFSMSHSRNIAFLNSKADIVTNVDADNFTGRSFAVMLNKLAATCQKKAFFSKGKRGLHGRIGMYKSEFQQIGGYDEDLRGYGFDDHSLMIRAMNSGFKMMWWGGLTDEDFTRRLRTPRNRVAENMIDKNWRNSEMLNHELTINKVERGVLVTNQGRPWGVIDDLEQVMP